jgi:uncharacterized membrane protein YphA (DoxX/SURF4 family)
MFPIGMPGVALIVLRTSVAVTLLVEGFQYWPARTSVGWMIPLIILSAALFLGLMTPYCSTLCCLLDLGTIWKINGLGEFHLAISAAVSAVLAVLGPGAYSVDARIFGRKLLNIAPRKTTRKK